MLLCGIGGLTAAATLAKLGKKVLVLEQDKQAGGLCKTFTEKGFEFDCGVAVKTEGEDIEVQAPVIISNVGMFTTFKKLLPPELLANLGNMKEYFDSDREDAPDSIPMMYISFSSAKDPTSCTRFPG
ncbi:unnamed protein product [Leuciscus chuanchicus]